MKKSFFLLFLCFLTIASYSQVRWNVFAGPQATSVHYTIKDKKQDAKMKYGFQLGGGLDVQWENRVYFAPQVFYSLKGFKVKLAAPSFPPDTLATDNDVTMHSFEIAALIQYNFSAEPSHFFMRVGPSIDFQISGKEKFNRSSGDAVSRKMKFSYGDYGRFGANINLHAGYQMAGGFMIYGQYGIGVGSIVNADEGPLVTHRAGGITLGYRF